MKIQSILLLAGCAWSALQAPAAAAPGDLDLSFAGTGFVRTGFGGGQDVANGVVLQPDGKALVAGAQSAGGHSDFVVIRYGTDGTPDPSFGVGGKVRTDFGSPSEQATSVALQSDGKIVVAGQAQGRLHLVRYLSDGALDPSFDGDGHAEWNFTGGYGEIRALRINGLDGKIVVAGRDGSQILVARFHSNGALDTTFNGTGIVLTPILSSTQANAMAIQGDGKIVVAGETTGGVFKAIVLARYNTNGSQDTSFDGDGIVITTLNGDAQASALAFQISATVSKFLVVGHKWNNSILSSILLRYDWNGVHEYTYPIATGLSTGDDQATAVQVQYAAGNPSRIYIAGSMLVGETWDVFVSKHFVAGNLDTTFGSGGIVTAGIGSGDDFCNTMIRTGAGKFLIAGLAVEGSWDFATLQFNSNATLDTGWDADGRRTEDLGHGYSHAEAVAIQPDGDLVAAGQVLEAGYLRFALVRYLGDGQPDPSFGVGGRQTTRIGEGYEEEVRSVLIQPDGKILAFGVADSLRTDSEFALARYHSDGSLDLSFGFNEYGQGTGKRTLNFNNDAFKPDEGRAMLLQADQRILVAGQTLLEFGPLQMAVARLMPNGALDPSFGSNGRTIVSSFQNCGANAMAFAPDGKIYLVGTSGNAVAVARLLANGSIDPSFDFDGMVVATDALYATEALVQSDGRIVVGAVAPGNNIVLMRFNPNASRDGSFGTGGVVSLPIGSSIEGLQSTANGDILVTGKLWVGESVDCSVHRFDTNGNAVTSFGINGSVIFDLFPTGDDEPRAIRLDANGRILVAGVVGGLFGVARLEGDPPTSVPETDEIAGRFSAGMPHPNPTRSSSVVFLANATTRVEAAIFDVAGRRVRALSIPAPVAGRRVVEWDGRDDSGRAVAAGIYHLRVQHGPQVLVRSITRLR